MIEQNSLFLLGRYIIPNNISMTCNTCNIFGADILIFKIIL